MNRIAIGCLALLLAGCCKRSELDCRLVGTWVVDTCNFPEGVPEGVENMGVYRFRADGVREYGWSYNLEDEELFLDSALASEAFWRTVDGRELWHISYDEELDSSRVFYRFERGKLVLNFFDDYPDHDYYWWRYD